LCAHREGRLASAKRYNHPMASLTPDEHKQAVELHHKKTTGKPLTDTEELLVSRFYQVMAAKETERLAPAMERLEQKIAAELERQERLHRLLEREKILYAQLKSIVEEIEAIDAEHKHIVAAGAV
jgi:DNA-binding transcriptional regulator YbjK